MTYRIFIPRLLEFFLKKIVSYELLYIIIWFASQSILNFFV